MFLAHVSHTSLVEILEMEAKDVSFLHTEAVKLHNKLNPIDNG